MASTTLRQSAARRATVPTMAQFFMNGATFGTWGIQIPVIKSQLGATDAMMSIAMLCVAGGAVLAMSHIGRWVARVGSARAMTLSSLAYAVTLLGIPMAGNFAVLLPILLVFGATMAAFDVAMNVQAASVEIGRGTPVMSTMHGMFSVGGMTGAAAGGLMLSAGLSLQAHAVVMAAILIAVALLAAPRLLADAPAEHSDAHAASGKIPAALWVLGIVAFLGLVCEGAMYDWSAIYMHDVAGASLATSGYAYAAFSLGMAAGRFCADPLRRSLSAGAMLSGSAWLGFAGICVVIALPTPAGSLTGLAMMGLGIANFMPFFFLAGTKLPGLSPAAGVAGVGRFAYAGMLFGPPLIGAITHATSLRVGLGAVAVTMGGIALLGIRQVHKVTAPG